MTLGRIPWTAVNAYARANGVVARERFEHMILRMDSAYLVALHKPDADGKKGEEVDGG